MVLVSAVTVLGLYVADRNLVATYDRELEQTFGSELTALHHARETRHAMLTERCRALVRKPRIHASLEDGALDLLYPSAEEELRDVTGPVEPNAPNQHVATLRARFYRFLDGAGRVISAPPAAPVGTLNDSAEAQLSLRRLPREPQVGYLEVGEGSARELSEVIATPIVSTETGEAIAALVLGFRPLAVPAVPLLQSGIWSANRLHWPASGVRQAEELSGVLRRTLQGGRGVINASLGGEPHRVFYELLNGGSDYPPAYEICAFSLSEFVAHRANLRLRIGGIGLALLAAAFVASRSLAGRLSAPVEKLAIDSERSARFSADASHQLKTPVAVLRAGLDELLSRENLTPEECDAIAALIHQTYRLSSLIDDLLLLSRMDAGRLRLKLAPVDLAHLIAAAVDDLDAMPDELDLQIQTDLPESLHVAGERRYTAIILQNLLENARKYNRPHGRIRIRAQVNAPHVVLSIANTGKPIPHAAREHIFERFHRGSVGENVPGYGLGLNLARELARLHEGDLALVRSDQAWTEFRVTFRLAAPALMAT
jgi:signal transduction histidine kinase